MSISSPWERVTPTLRALFVGLSIVAVLATGCGGGSGGEAASGSTDTTTTSGEDGGATTAGDQTDAESGEGDDSSDSGSGDESYLDAESPLSAYLGFDMSSSDAQEQQREIELKVKECMSAQGFEYEMNDVGDMGFYDDFEDMGTLEYAAEHGYGMTESFTAASADAAGEDGGYVDPNADILAAMSGTEQEAWQTALSGPMLDETTLEEGGATFMEPAGCYGEASSEVYGDFAVFEQLAPAFDAMDAQFYADPRVVEINVKWAACMKDAGYDFENPDDAINSINEKMNEILSQDFALDAPPPADGEGTEDPAAMMPDFSALQPQIDELNAEEIAVATADAKCAGDDQKKLQEIGREYELKFIEENKATLDAANS